MKPSQPVLDDIKKAFPEMIFNNLENILADFKENVDIKSDTPQQVFDFAFWCFTVGLFMTTWPKSNFNSKFIHLSPPTKEKSSLILP